MFFLRSTLSLSFYIDVVLTLSTTSICIGCWHEGHAVTRKMFPFDDVIMLAYIWLYLRLTYFLAISQDSVIDGQRALPGTIRFVIPGILHESAHIMAIFAQEIGWSST